MEVFIESQQSLPSTHMTQSQPREDRLENGMKVPTSVLDGCGGSFQAADEKRQKASTCFFADTGSV